MGQKAESKNASMIAACHSNFISAHEAVAWLVPGGLVERVGGLTFVRSGMAGSVFNLVFGLSAPTSLKEVREGIDRIFVKTGTQFTIITTPETQGLLKPLIDDVGLTVGTDVPGMVLDPIPEVSPDPPKGLEIRLLTELEEVKRYLRIGAVSFEMPQDYLDVWAPRLVAGSPSFSIANYIGYADGNPAATSLRYTTAHLAGIYLVSTLHEFRRRGFGEAMTWRAVMDGKIDGCTASYLQASSMGRPVYEHMGFRVLEEYKEWSAEAQESTSPNRTTLSNSAGRGDSN